MKNIHNYDEIIDMPYQKSIQHPHMSNADRAAQFAPFAALTGHKAVLHETARITDQRKILDENQITMINQQLQDILLQIHHHPHIQVTYFLKDQIKKGGEYITITKRLKKIDEYEHILLFEDGTNIYIHDIYEIEMKPIINEID